MVNRRGFTLIELMLVVIIIGVLAAMVMPRLVGRSEEARIAAAKSDINSAISLALDLYEMDTGSFPDKLEDLRAKTGKGPYLKKDPKDPWGRAYEYEKLGDKECKICSKGADENKADDDICNQ